MTKDNHNKHNDHKPPEAKPEKQEEVKTDPEAEEKITILKKEYDELLNKSKEVTELRDKFLRTHAEFENARRRIGKDKIDFMRFANESFIIDFLPILDSLEISEKHIK